MLTYKQSDDLEFICYSNSDFVVCVDSQKSTSAYIFMLVGEAISWRSSKQTLVTTSIMDVEFVSCFEDTSHVCMVKEFYFWT